MALMLTQVSITCMAKLRDERFISPSVLNSDSVTCLDVIMTKRLSNGACHSTLYKIMMAILRHDTLEALRMPIRIASKLLPVLSAHTGSRCSYYCSGIVVS